MTGPKWKLKNLIYNYMAKKNIILVFFPLILLALILYLILTSESAKPAAKTVKPAPTGGAAGLEENYQDQAKQLFTDYENLAQNNNFTADKITELKNKLLALKVPAKFKELHLQFVLALTKMENYFNQPIQPEKNDSWRMINQLKADYGWLNN